MQKCFRQTAAMFSLVILAIALFPASAVFAAADAFQGDAYPNVCAAVTIEREEIGGTRFPIHPQYKHLPWLGQVFTADRCGETRLGERYFGDDGTYTHGSTIWLKRAPTKYLRRLLWTVGYELISVDPDGVETWRLEGEVPVYKLLLLKPYASKMEQDDCVHCG